MSVKLKIENLPLNINVENIKEIFQRFQGFKNAQLLQNPHNQSIYGVIQFLSYETALGTKNYLEANPPFPSENLKIDILFDNYYPPNIPINPVKSTF